MELSSFSECTGLLSGAIPNVCKWSEVGTMTRHLEELLQIISLDLGPGRNVLVFRGPACCFCPLLFLNSMGGRAS